MKSFKLFNKHLKIPRLKPWQTGFIAGLVGALAQASYNFLPRTIAGTPAYKIGPIAYSICIFCHVRDLMNWFIKGLVPWMSPASISAVVPALTIIGVIIGATLAAIISKETSVRWTINPRLSFICGIFVAFFAAILGACPIRVVLRSAYFDAFGFVGWGSLMLGVIIATEFILKKAG